MVWHCFLLHFVGHPDRWCSGGGEEGDGGGGHSDVVVVVVVVQAVQRAELHNELGAESPGGRAPASAVLAVTEAAVSEGGWSSGLVCDMRCCVTVTVVAGGYSV